ncbi:MAG TPA: hypothetical protein VGM97_06165 [Steroidobacteraceae bacterium]
MSVFGPRTQSRTAAILVVAVVHGLMLWCIWRARAPVADEIESFASVMFFVPQPPSRPTAPASTPLAPRADRTVRSHLVPAPQVAEATTAITLPATPSGPIDWPAQLQATARVEIDREDKARKQLRQVTRKFEVDPDPRNPGRAPASSFRWDEAGIHRIDTRGSLPVLHLNDRCAMLMFIIPVCSIGHIEIHGDLFDGAAAVHDARLATPGPNEVP